MSELQHNSKTKVDAAICRQFFAQANVSSNPSPLNLKRSLNKRTNLKFAETSLLGFAKMLTSSHEPFEKRAKIMQPQKFLNKCPWICAAAGLMLTLKHLRWHGNSELSAGTNA